MWCLARMLPLLVGDPISVQNSHWENFLLLLRIEEILFAPTTITKSPAYLVVPIQEYLESFSKLYTRPIIPKQCWNYNGRGCRGGSGNNRNGPENKRRSGKNTVDIIVSLQC